MTVRVADLYPCIQGEGAMSGTPMVLVRLQGCDVGCPWCDTKETWPAEAPPPAAAEGATTPVAKLTTLHAERGHALDATVQEVAYAARWVAPGVSWAMVTGGEPLMQSETSMLGYALRAQGLRTLLETSGTEEVTDAAAWNWICVSPKLDMAGGKVVTASALANAHEIKMVIGKAADVEKLDRLLLANRTRLDCLVSLQPLSQHPGATALCVAMAQARGWRLSVQLHKYLGEP